MRKMHVMSLVVRLHLEKSTNKRLRRLCIESIVDTIHRHFNVSIAEIGGESRLQEITIAATCVARNKKLALDVLERVTEALASYPDSSLLNHPDFLNH
jgi:uncharacterized protein YlxP (DUF503 family)